MKLFVVFNVHLDDEHLIVEIGVCLARTPIVYVVDYFWRSNLSELEELQLRSQFTCSSSDDLLQIVLTTVVMLRFRIFSPMLWCLICSFYEANLEH